MLSVTEFENVYSWKPYRNDWPVDMDQKDQTILEHFGALIKDMINNEAFECTQTQAGDITNYLEFLCYPSTVKDDNTDQPGILVCVSICAPIAIYCESHVTMPPRIFQKIWP
ncbi:MAG: hypothetical protein EOO02_05245 [Chitinophagaceae bacterium]|nr:MAG: hypothetical protein EOO02_05245 [Chitinophagaceae bacterium]